MRRSSVITIVLLVLVIIGLIVALVITNLPQKESVDENNVIENNESLEDEKQQEEIVEETPTSVSLDSQIVKDMYDIVNGRTGDIFHCLKKGKLTVEDLSDEYIQTIAYFNSAEDNVEKFDTVDNQMRYGKLEKRYMDEAVKKIFGDVEYEPTYVLYQSGDAKMLIYEPSENVYYMYGGFGGGSNKFTHHAITKVEEYSDKYVVTEKMLTDDYTNGYHHVYSYYGQGYVFTSDLLDSITDSDIDSIDVSQDMYSQNEKSKKLISKYYDDATEYQHTFVKNADGTYYWLKTEIVK